MKLSESPLIKEVDKEKNDLDVVSLITCGSGKKLWWICHKGHSWEARVYSRVNGSGCPYCFGQAVGYGNSLKDRFPDVAKEWCSSNKGNPSMMAPYSNKVVKWICGRCRESWSVAISKRTGRNSGCPRCYLAGTSRLEKRFLCELRFVFGEVLSGKKIGKYKCDLFIESNDYKIAIEVDGSFWHKGKETNDLEKNAFLKSKGIQLFRLRGIPLLKLDEKDILFDESRDDSILQAVKNLVEVIGIEIGVDVSLYLNVSEFKNVSEYGKLIGGFDVPLEKRMTTVIQKVVMREWDYERNTEDPNRLSYGSKHKVWWKCKKGHCWQDSPYARHHGSSCHYCSGRKVGKDNSLQFLCPELALDWHEKNELKASEVTLKSNIRIWWKCRSCTHEWQSAPNNRSKGHGCPVCVGMKPSQKNNLAALHPELVKEWGLENRDSPENFLPKSNIKVWWRCSKGHSWRALIANRSKGHGCPTCNTGCVSYS